MSKAWETDLEMIKITSKEILLSFVDLVASSYASQGFCRKPLRSYLGRQEGRREEFFERLKYLKRRGYIEFFVEGKEKYIELTPKGKQRTKDLFTEDFEIERPKKWDHKWRVIIFDIAEIKKANRNTFRNKLLSLGFVQIQKSVYVFPFECATEIQTLALTLGIIKDVTIMISEIIQGEESIIEKFLDKEILKPTDLKRAA
jgi:CRISPR-associated endonuclease Cas2